MLLKKDIKNLFSIAFSQGLNYLFPILIMPLASNRLGIEAFGKSLYAYYFVFYFSIFINYGFDISGSNLIAKSNSSFKLNKISNLIFSSKLILFLISTFIFTAILIFYDKVADEKLLFTSSYIYALASFLIPSWLFIGKSDFFIYNIYQAVSKLLFLILVFFFIKSPKDYIIFNFYQSITFLGLAIFLNYYAAKKYNLIFKLSKIKLLLIFLLSKSLMFLNTLSIFLYTSMNQVLIGSLSTFENTSLYTVSARILTGYVAIFVFPLGVYYLPQISKKINEDQMAGLKFIIKTSKIYLFVGILASISLYFTQKFAIDVFFGKEYKVLNNYLPIIVFIPFFISLSNLFGNITFSNIKKEKKLLFFTTLVGVLSLILNLILLPRLGLKGAIYTWFFSECLISTLCVGYFFTYFYKLNNTQ
jgi:PST family polysaccharide transporter